jgi:RNA polymerase sigma-54 factor
MALELRQELKLTQQLVMTPQLQQAIKLLQLNRLELQGLIQQELQENPVLEEADVEEETSSEREDATPGQESDIGLEKGAVAGDSPELAATAVEGGTEPELGMEVGPTDAEKIADIEWENYMDAYPQTGLVGRGGEDDERRSFETTHARRPTLAEHLEWQLHLSDFDEIEIEVARWIIGNLDDDGYLRATVEEIGRQSGASEELVQQVLTKVHSFDPTGVAARDLRECLLLQLGALGIHDGLVFDIVERHLDLLQKRDFRGLTRVLGVTIEEIAAAGNVIARFEPRPGRAFGGDEPVYITPDIYVYKMGEDFHILLNEDGMPKLRINNLYRDVLSRRGHASKDTKEYVHDKVRSAMWLIKSIHQRQRTMYKVMNSIIKFQGGFFENGVSQLKPLNLRDVADDIEMHESTVSRVTSNKYVHTPQGIFELKYFFNSSINRFQGEAIASESVKAKIRKIISSEDSRRPLSDQRIAEMLKSANIDIARRTVTKYREAMNLLSSTKRRQVG